MNSPALTWRVRRIGHTLWSSVRTRNKNAWSWIERVQRAALPGNAGVDRTAPSMPSAADEPCEMNDAYHWLAALRLDRAAAAVADPD
jgi:hypothetical protein